MERKRIRKRVRVRSGKGVRLPEETKNILDTMVLSIATDMKVVSKANARIKDKMEQLSVLMGEKKLSTWETEAADAKTITPPTRATRVIDPLGFWEATTFEEFIDTVTVPMAGAKKILSGKELDKITIKGQTKQKPDEIKVILK